MTDPKVDAIAARLVEEGLTDPVFDPDEIAADIADRMAMFEELDLLIGDRALDPTAHDVRWR